MHQSTLRAFAWWAFLLVAVPFVGAIHVDTTDTADRIAAVVADVVAAGGILGPCPSMKSARVVGDYADVLALRLSAFNYSVVSASSTLHVPALGAVQPTFIVHPSPLAAATIHSADIFTAAMHAAAAGLPQPDVVLCLDVAQHVPEADATAFVGSVVSGVPPFVVFSAATVGEGFVRTGRGDAFVHEAAVAWWERAFTASEYVLDVVATVRLRNALLHQLDANAQLLWIAKNIVAFRPAGRQRSSPNTLRQHDAYFSQDPSTVRWLSLEPQNVGHAMAQLSAADGYAYYQRIREPFMAAEGRSPLSHAHVVRPLNVSGTCGSVLPSPSDIRSVVGLFLAGEYSAMHNRLLGHLEAFLAFPIRPRFLVSDWISTFFYVVSRPDVDIREYEKEYARFSRTLEQLASEGQKDPAATLLALRHQAGGDVKMRALFPRQH